MQEPIVPGLLEEARNVGGRSAKADHISRHKGMPKNRVIVERPGRPTMTFVDVGRRFVDPGDEAKRFEGRLRRKRIKAKRGREKVAGLRTNS